MRLPSYLWEHTQDLAGSRGFPQESPKKAKKFIFFETFVGHAALAL